MWLLLSLMSLSGCLTPPDPRPDPANQLNCDPVTERCISISQKEFDTYLACLGDRAMLRHELKALKGR